MKACFSTLGCPEWTFERIIKNTIQYEFSGVEMIHIKDEQSQDIMNSDSRKKLKTLLKQYDVEFVMLGTYIDFCNGDKSLRKKREKELFDYILVAQELSAKGVRIFPGRYQDTDIDEGMAVEYIVESINNVVSKINSTDVKIYIETHGNFCSAHQLTKILDNTDPCYTNALWDVGNSSYNGKEEFFVSLNLLNERIKHIHLKDYYVENGRIIYCPIGEGIVPLSGIIKSAVENGYDGYFSFEWEKRWVKELPELDKVLPSYKRLFI